MASESLGLDDIMATLMSMGFELNDCQDAVTNGKLTVQAAIDWILAGKPGNVSAQQSQPSLKLNKASNSRQLDGNTSNPFVQENVSALRGSTTTEPSSSSDIMGVDVEEDTVVSRSHLSEKQQQIKLTFEEKERQEARKNVQEEKRRKKLERERILKEIQEDREKQKMTKPQKLEAATTPAAPSQSQAAPPTTSDTQTQSGQSSGLAEESGESNYSTTSIQVRLPSGRMFRQNFPVTDTLNTVWDAVYQQIKTAMNAHSGFIQPFPRREFTREEMGQALSELGLVPSGSLVLKKKDAQQQAAQDNEPEQPPAVMRALEEAERERMEEEEEELDPREILRPEQHNWGRGFRVEGGEDSDEEPMDEDEDPGIPLGQADPLEQFMGLAAHPILGNPPVFQGFGQRLVPVGVPGDNNAHLRRSAGSMAAEAAAHRMAQPQLPPPDNFEPRGSHSELVFNTHTLQDLAMFSLTRRLTDPRNPIFSMSGLPEELLQKFLAYLIKERLLKPKILHLMPSYLLKLNLDYYPYTTNELLHAARIFIHLHTLSLNSCPLITDAGLSPVKGMKALKTLSISGCSQITNACFSVISELTNLQTLNLEGTGVTDVGVVEFAMSCRCPCLVHLDLSRTAVTHGIFPSLCKFPKLRSLYLKQSQICSLAGIDGLPTLENLDISDTNIVTDSILCLTRLPNLHQLSLTNNQGVLGDSALCYLKDVKLTALLLPSRSSTSDVGISYISGFQLSALDLTNYTNVTDAGMVHVGKIISLKKLLLSNTKVSDEGMQYLSGLVNLEVLFVDRTFVSNVGAAVVANFKNLNELSLSGTSVTGQFLSQGVLNTCVSLTKLNLSRTIIGDKGIVHLALPNLQLLNLDCTRVHPQSVTVIQKNCPQVKTVTIANLSSLREDNEDN